MAQLRRDSGPLADRVTETMTTNPPACPPEMPDRPGPASTASSKSTGFPAQLLVRHFERCGTGQVLLGTAETTNIDAGFERLPPGTCRRRRAPG